MSCLISSFPSQAQRNSTLRCVYLSTRDHTVISAEHHQQDQEKLPDALQFLPPTKTREPDTTLRLTHVETLLLLCHTRWGRDYLREHGVYEIVRAAHENESVDKARSPASCNGYRALSHTNSYSLYRSRNISSAWLRY